MKVLLIVILIVVLGIIVWMGLGFYAVSKWLDIDLKSIFWTETWN